MNKKALIITSIGTSVKKSLNELISLSDKLSKDISDIQIFNCFISTQLQQNLLKKENIYIYTLKEILSKLNKENYKNIIILPLQIITGIEYQNIINTLLSYNGNFYSVDLKKPLLYYENDFKIFCKLLFNIQKNKNIPLICVAHGTTNKLSSTYIKLQETLKILDYDNIYISTLQGEPNFDNLIPILLRNNIKEVYLLPLTLTHSTHTIRDIFNKENSCYSKLKGLNIKVNQIDTPLCNMQEVADIFKSHLNI